MPQGYGPRLGVLELHRQTLREGIGQRELAVDDRIGEQEPGEHLRDRADLEQHLLGSHHRMPGRKRLAGKRELPAPAASLGRRDRTVPQRGRPARGLDGERRRFGGLRAGARAQEAQEQEAGKSAHG
ncbi:MAG TPA: hypothetical protein VOA80_09425 [Thermoanaerobaculia bacterium]|nr:hypothetical protein [Thermoanaerobaculia bacterium]